MEGTVAIQVGFTYLDSANVSGVEPDVEAYQLPVNAVLWRTRWVPRSCGSQVGVFAGPCTSGYVALLTTGMVWLDRQTGWNRMPPAD